MLGVTHTLISLLDHTLYNSLGYVLVALGVLISIRFLGFPDLTVDGAFTLGACGYATAIKANIPLPLAIGFACTLGMAAGAITTVVNQHLKIGKIISSVLVMTAAITITPYIAGNSTLGLLESDPLINTMNVMDLHYSEIWFGKGQLAVHPTITLFFLTIISIVIIVVGSTFKLRTGIKMRYIGSAVAPGLIPSKSRSLLLALGLAIGNGVVAIGGAVEAERNGGFSSGMGFGALLIGLTVLVLGESILKVKLRRDCLSVGESLVAVIIGVCVYSLGIQLILIAGFRFVDIRLLTTIFLLAALSISSYYHPNSTKLF